jgi:transcription factor SPN1
MSSAGSGLGSPLADSNHIPDTLRGGDYDGSSRTGDGPAQDTADLSDDESILSEVDEAQFENFDPENVAIEDRPALAIDEENLKLIGRHKRKRTEDGDDTEPKKKKEGRREKRTRRQMDSDDAFSGGDDASGKRTRKRKGRERKRRETTPEAEELLDPATSEPRISRLFGVSYLVLTNVIGRRKALDRAMDEALKKPTRRRFRKADGIVLSTPSSGKLLWANYRR